MIALNAVSKIAIGDLPPGAASATDVGKARVERRMAEYEAVLRRAIDTLGATTPDLRGDIYRTARTAMETSISRTESLPPRVAAGRRNVLEEVIAQLELQYVRTQERAANSSTVHDAPLGGQEPSNPMSDPFTRDPETTELQQPRQRMEVGTSSEALGLGALFVELDPSKPVNDMPAVDGETTDLRQPPLPVESNASSKPSGHDALFTDFTPSDPHSDTLSGYSEAIELQQPGRRMEVRTSSPDPDALFAGFMPSNTVNDASAVDPANAEQQPPSWMHASISSTPPDLEAPRTGFTQSNLVSIASAVDEVTGELQRLDAATSSKPPDIEAFLTALARSNAVNEAQATDPTAERQQPRSRMDASLEQRDADPLPSTSSDRTDNEEIGITLGSDGLLKHIHGLLATGLVPLDGSWVAVAEREAEMHKRNARAPWLVLQAAVAITGIVMASCVIALLLLAVAY